MDIAPNVLARPVVDVSSECCGSGGYSYTFPGRQRASDVELGHFRSPSWETCSTDDDKDSIPTSLQVFVTVTVSTREDIIFTSPFGDDDIPLTKTSAQVFAPLSKAHPADPLHAFSDSYAAGKRQSLPFLPSFSRRRRSTVRSSRAGPLCLDVSLDGSQQQVRFRKQTLSETTVQDDRETRGWLVRVMNKIAAVPEEGRTMSGLVRH